MLDIHNTVARFWCSQQELRSKIGLKYDEFNYPFVSQVKANSIFVLERTEMSEKQYNSVTRNFLCIKCHSVQSSTPSDLGKGNEHSHITVRLYKMSLLSCPWAQQLLRYVREDTGFLRNKGSLRVDTTKKTLCVVIILALHSAQLMRSVTTLEFRRNQ